MGTFGGTPNLTEGQVRTIASLHPEVLAAFKRGAIGFSLESGVPATTGSDLMRLNLFDDEERESYERIMEEASWTYPDGESVEDIEEVTAETFDGEWYEAFGDERFLPSVFSQANSHITTERAKQSFDNGFGAVQFDNIRSLREEGLDFSIWAQAAFRERLSGLSATRLNELGVDNPESLDIRDYLNEQGLSPLGDGQLLSHPAEDPVFREYLLHHHIGVKELLDDLKTWLRDTYPNRSPPLYFNQPIADDDLAQTAVAHTYLSEHADLSSTEDFRTMPAVDFGHYHGHRDVPDKDIRDYVYKLLLAVGRYETPVHVWDTFGGEYYQDLQPDDRHPMLLRLQAAEAYAMGGRRWLNLSQGPLLWRNPDWTVPETLRDFVDFLWAHQRFLKDVEPANTVGVVWSLPTLLWNTIPQWNIDAKAHTLSVLGTVTLLREAQLPYDFVVFGHPDLWPDTNIVERVSAYDALVLPALECITDNQLAGLDVYLNEEGLVLSSGPIPERTGQYTVSEGGFDVFDRNRVIVKEDDPGRRRLNDVGAGTSLVDALVSHNIESVTVGTDRTIGVNLLNQPDESRHILHLLNYDYDPDTDEFRQKANIDLQLSGLDDRFEFARYYSPQRITDLAIKQRNDRHGLTVPKLVEWGFIVIAPYEDNLDDPGSEQEATALVSEAETGIQEAHDDGRQWSKEYTLAKIKHQSAETAFEYDAHSLAIKEAEAAVKLADAAPDQLVIGIDQAHGQLESQEARNWPNPVEQLRREIPDYKYRNLQEWGNTTLSDVDVLLIPPVVGSKGQYEFTRAEIERIESFVAHGGSLAVLGRAGVASDINELISQFDLRFHGTKIISPVEGGSAWVRARVHDSTHRLTLALEEIDGLQGTPIAVMSDHATVLASVPEDSDAWIHQTGELTERDEGEPSAAGSHIYTVQEHGRGLIVALGISEPLYDPTGGNRVLMSRLFGVLGRHAWQVQRNTTLSPSNSSMQSHTTDRTPNGKTTVEEESPGFGLVAAIAGITSFIAYLLRTDCD